MTQDELNALACAIFDAAYLASGVVRLATADDLRCVVSEDDAEMFFGGAWNRQM